MAFQTRDFALIARDRLQSLSTGRIHIHSVLLLSWDSTHIWPMPVAALRTLLLTTAIILITGIEAVQGRLHTGIIGFIQSACNSFFFGDDQTGYKIGCGHIRYVEEVIW